MKKEAHKHIAITIDKNYAIDAAVMLYSLLVNNNAKDIHVHIITDFKNIFYKIPVWYVLRKNRCKYSFYKIDKNDIKFSDHLVITNHITIATYFRLFLPSILKNIEKVLFLDSDMIIDGNINTLYDTNINANTLAAVIANNEERIAALQMNRNYFNAGVMLLNLQLLREGNYEEKFSRFIVNNRNKIKFWDQDVLNAVAGNNFIAIDKKWNCLSYNYDTQTPPVIIHYAGTLKPWTGYSTHPLKDKYFQYLHSDTILKILEKCYRFYFRSIVLRVKKFFH